MNNEIKITGVVPAEELKAMKDLLELFEKTKTAYSELATKLAGGLNIKPNSLQELKLKAEDATKVMREMALVQNQLAQIQEDYKKLVLQLNEATKARTATIVEEAKANDLNAAATLKTEKAETERLKQQKLSNQEAKQRKVSIEEAIALTKVEVKTEREATEQNRLLRLARKDLDVTTEEGRKVLIQMNGAIDKNTEFIRRNADSMTKQKMTIGDYSEQIKKAHIELQNGQNGFRNIGIIAKGFGGILKESVVGGLNEMSSGIGNMIKGFIGAQAVIGGFQRLIGFFQSGFKSVIDFEAANSKLAAVLGTTSKNMKDLTTDAQRLGAATKYTASEATNLQIELAKLGFSKTEILQSTEYVLKFAQATGAELPEAAALAGASLRMFNADTTETERYVSAMAVATTKSALSFSYLQTAMPIVGPVAKSFNFQIEDTLALLGKLSDAGFDASMAATATRNIFLNLADSGGKLAKELGGPVKTLPDLVNGLKTLKERGVDLNTTLKLTDKRSVAAMANFIEMSDTILPLREQITGVTKELGDMADEMGNNVQGAILGLSSAWEAFMLSIIKSKSTIKGVIDSIAEWLRNLAFEGMSGEEDVLGMETKLKKDAEVLAKGDVEKAQGDFNKRMKDLKAQGLNDDEAYTKAVEEISKKRIDISRKEQKEVDFNRGKAIISEQNWKDDINKGWGYINNKFANFFRYTTSTAKDADEAMAGYARNYTEYMKSLSFNAGIDDIIANAQPKKGANFVPIKTQEEIDKEKAAAEKAAKERLRIQQSFQQSELDLMDEGLSKEIEKISLSYTKKMAAVKGMSEEEIKTRENLAKEMKRAIEDKTINYSIAQEQKMISDKLEAVKKGSQEEYDSKVRQLELLRDVEIMETTKTDNDVILIEEKYNAKRTELLEKFSSDKAKKIEEGSAVQSIILNQQMQSELDVLTESYTKGLIDKEAYERKKAEIAEKYAIKQAELAIAVIEAQLAVGDFSPEDRMALEKKLANARIALSAAVRDAEISDTKKTAEEREEDMNKLMDKIQMAGDFLNAFSDLGASLFEGRIQKIEEEQDALEESKEAELDKIQKLEESGAISKEEAEARKRAAEDKTSQKDKELAKKKADLQTKQAKMDKANAIAQSIIATALAVTQALPNFVLAAMVGVLGAVQLATIIAQPIPKYREGTKDHPGGLAVVGDGGQREAIITPSGDSFITPNIATMVDIPKHSMVIPNLVDYVKQIKLKSDLGLTMKDAEMRGEPININVSNDFRSLEKKLDRMSDSFDNLAKYQRKAAVESELNYLKSRL